MSREDVPLTPRELARLLRAFAHLIEASADDATHEPTRAPRRRRAPNVSPPSPVTAARATAALKKLGVIP